MNEDLLRYAKQMQSMSDGDTFYEDSVKMGTLCAQIVIAEQLTRLVDIIQAEIDEAKEEK